MAETTFTALEKVGVKCKSLQDYQRIIGGEFIDKINVMAEQLKGVRLLHLNATASGGGVAELLNSLVSLERGLWIEGGVESSLIKGG